jgi:hypothetical protein
VNINLEELTGGYQPVSLEKLDDLVLLDRIDDKYVLNVQDLAAILDGFGNEYQILEINSERVFSYKTIYYDTPDNQLYHAHHRGKPRRYKVRTRQYLNSGVSFFEVKLKTKRDKTLKKRIETDFVPDPLSGKLKKFFEKNNIPAPETLEPRLTTCFSRFTLLGFKSHERITVDTGLSFQLSGKSIDMGPLAILELKHEEHGNGGSELAAMLKKFHVPRTGFSKYCIGMALLNPEVKYNRFKSKILNVNKICHVNFSIPASE